MFLLFIDREATPQRQIIDLLATDNYDILLSLVQYLLITSLFIHGFMCIHPVCLPFNRQLGRAFNYLKVL